MFIMLSQYVFLYISVFSFSNGRKSACNYAFKGLDANITLSSSLEIFDLAHRISLYDLTTGKPAGNKYFFLEEPSHYFFLEDRVLLVTACLPAGLRVNLTFIIEGEDDCSPGYLMINVKPTVPVFDAHSDLITVDFKTCSSKELIEVHEIEFQNKEECTTFNCSVFCESCKTGKSFWTNKTKILTDSEDLQFGSVYIIQVACFDSNLTKLHSKFVAVTEFGVMFRRFNICPSSRATSPSSPTIFLTTKTSSSARTKTTSRTAMATLIDKFSPVLSTIRTMNAIQTTGQKSKIGTQEMMTTTGVTSTQTAAKILTSSMLTTINIQSTVKETFFKATAKFSSGVPATFLLTKTSPMSSNIAHPLISATALTPLLTTTKSPASNYIKAVRFFDETLNIAVVSAVGGVVFLFALISVIFTVWSRCCRFGIACIQVEDDEKERT